MIKGISYIPTRPGHRTWDKNALIDPLSEEWLGELRRDVPYLQQLGINTISVVYFDTAKCHDRALALLRDEGIHVLIQLLGDLRDALPDLRQNDKEAYDRIQPAEVYTTDIAMRTFEAIKQTSRFPNVLGYQLSACALHSSPQIKFSTVVRAAVRDCKRYLRDSHRRQTPVGVCVADLMMFKKSFQHFFTAGNPEERADFFAFDCYSWAGAKSSFKISGYENMVRMLGEVPVPMFLSSYGTTVSQPRNFTEVDCLYSPDMTGVFSGGVAYTYMRSGHDRQDKYPLIVVGENGSRQRKRDFGYLKGRLTRLSKRSDAEVFGDHKSKDYESWRGTFPEKTVNFPADPDEVPAFPMNWETVLHSDLPTAQASRL